jgi:anti-sigma factor ChrR (cupin superfamily)
MVRTLRAAAVFIAGAALAAAAWAQHGSHMIVTPGDLKWVDVVSLPPGAKIAVIEGKMNEAGPITARLKFPANYRVPPHTHGGIERVTVLTGTMNFGMGDKFDPKKTTPISAGSFLIMPPKMSHYVWTKEEAIAQINVMGPWTVTYVNPSDDPRNK